MTFGNSSVELHAYVLTSPSTSRTSSSEASAKMLLPNMHMADILSLIHI